MDFCTTAQIDKPLFSVAIVSYNQKKYIFDCIDSILKQDYPQIELIIADDHSYDFDQQEIENYIEKSKKDNLVRCKVYTNPENLGIVKNCNKVINQMQGDYAKVIAADDTLYDETVLTQMQRILSEPRNGIVCARGIAITNEGKPTEDVYPSDYDFSTMQCMSAQELYLYLMTRPWCPIFAPGAFMRTEFWHSMGGYNESYTYTEDWPFWIKVAKAEHSVFFADIFAVWYRYGGISNATSSEMPNHLREKHYKECIEIFRDEYPSIKAVASKGKILRCWYSAQAIEVKSVSEFDWHEMSLKSKLKFRIRKLPFIVYVKLLSAITFNHKCSVKKELIALGAAAIALFVTGGAFSKINFQKWIAVLVVLLGALVVLKSGINIFIGLLRMRASLKTKLSQK